MAGPTSLRIPVGACRRVRLSFQLDHQMCWSAAIAVAKRVLQLCAQIEHLRLGLLHERLSRPPARKQRCDPSWSRDSFKHREPTDSATRRSTGAGNATDWN